MANKPLYLSSGDGAASVPAGYVGERVFANTTGGNITSTSSFNNIQTIQLTKGIWLVTGLLVADNSPTNAGHTQAISIYSGNTTTDHVNGVNVMAIGVPLDRSSSTCIANYYITITADGNTSVYQKARALAAIITCQASIQAIRIA